MMKNLIRLLLLLFVAYSCTLDLKNEQFYYDVPLDMRLNLQSNDTIVFLNSDNFVTNVYYINVSSSYMDYDKKYYHEYLEISFEKVTSEEEKVDGFSISLFANHDKSISMTMYYRGAGHDLSLSYPNSYDIPDTTFSLGGIDFFGMKLFTPNSMDLKHYKGAPRDIQYTNPDGIIKYTFNDSTCYEIKEVRKYIGEVE